MCEHCDLDRFLQHFLPLCVDVEKKPEYDMVQSAIEKLQIQQRVTGATDAPVDPNEGELIRKRDILLQQCLADIMAVADERVDALLTVLRQSSLQMAEVERCEPYANACNLAYELPGELNPQAQMQSSKQHTCCINKALLEPYETRSDPEYFSAGYQANNSNPTYTTQAQKPEHISTSHAAVQVVRLTLEHVYLSQQPRKTSGRATSVFQCVNDSHQLGCKVSHREVKRLDEGNILALIGALCTDKDERINKAFATVYCRSDLKGCSALRGIQSVLGLDARGFRTHRIIVLQKLVPIIELKGRDFVKAWFDTVTCHAFLWKYGIEHGDPSLWNIMYTPSDQCGVLIDFDLSSVQFPASYQTGTIPFMALDLLELEYFEGKLTRYYHHELEAFIWVLLFVCLCYEDGKRVSSRNAPSGHEKIGADYTAQWLDENLVDVHRDKTVFMYSTITTKVSTHFVTSDFSDVTNVFAKIFRFQQKSCFTKPTWENENTKHKIPDSDKWSANYWTSFSKVLNSPAFSEFLTETQIDNFEKYKPDYAEKDLDGNFQGNEISTL